MWTGHRVQEERGDSGSALRKRIGHFTELECNGPSSEAANVIMIQQCPRVDKHQPAVPAKTDILRSSFKWFYEGGMYCTFTPPNLFNNTSYDYLLLCSQHATSEPQNIILNE